MVEIPESLIDKVFEWMGRENIIWFRHVKNLKKGINVVLKLNYEKKRIPVHPIHLREGMQIRNYLRSQPECKDWKHEDFESLWVNVIEKCIDKL